MKIARFLLLLILLSTSRSYASPEDPKILVLTEETFIQRQLVKKFYNGD